MTIPSPLRLASLLTLAIGITAGTAHAAIDRRAVVSRHDPVLRAPDPRSPLSVGNGQFAFTADVTGLQTFGDYYYDNGTPLETQARWSWHTTPNVDGHRLEDTFTEFTNYGRTVGYPTQMTTPAGRWMRENPHTHPLGRLALELRLPDGSTLTTDHLSGIHQHLDLWTGVLTSRYQLAGSPVSVVTTAHPDHDLVAVRIESPLLADDRLAVRLVFPRGHDMNVKNTPRLDFSQPDSHTTRVLRRDAQRVLLERSLDATRYEAAVSWNGAATFTETAPHTFRIAAAAGESSLEFSVAYAPDSAPAESPGLADTRAASSRHWEAFWRSGAAIDFAGSTDPRAHELERRVVLSQFLTAQQFGGDFPPQETGLTANSWFGKHHTEMVWWHTAHFALWGRDEHLVNTLRWYQGALPIARNVAASRGLRGARWPKMIGPDGRESPGGNPLIVWNQPHPIYLSELLYRNTPTRETLERYRELVFATTEGLVSMLNWDEARNQFVLGPPLWIAQEIYEQGESQNPSFELSYWMFALDLAQRWRERLGLPRSPEWDHVAAHLPPLPQKDGLYVALESHPDTFDNIASRHDHPTMLAPLGLLPGHGADRATMRRTLDAVLATWDWETKIWGWDYPMVAMTAARLGEPGIAVDVLLKSDSPNNDYMANGHCPTNPDLAVYMPANGSLLSAVAMMAVGWDGAPSNNAPGFPKDGTWQVRSEGLRPLP